MAKLLTQRDAAKRVGMGANRFRAICRAGEGPPVFNPPRVDTAGTLINEGRPMYVDTVVDAWLEARDDKQARRAS